MPSAPVPRLDGAAIQIKNIFYVFAGYGTIDYVSFFFIPSVCNASLILYVCLCIDCFRFSYTP